MIIIIIGNFELIIIIATIEKSASCFASTFVIYNPK